MTLPPDFWQYLLSAGVLLVVQWLSARLGVKLPVLTPPPPTPQPGPDPAPVAPAPVAPAPAPALLPAGGALLALVLRLLPSLLPLLLKGGTLAPEDKAALKILRQALPEETEP